MEQARKSGDEKVSKAFNQAAVQTLEVLASFSQNAGPIGVTELSRNLGISKNKAFRALRTLLEQGLVARSGEGSKYELGYGVVELQNANFPAPDILTLVSPYMERIQEMLGETVILSVLSGNDIVVLHGIEGHNSIVRRIPLGMSVPLHASAGSRAVLAFLPSEQIDSYIAGRQPLLQVTDRTITDPVKLKEELQLVRDRGYALGFGDYMSDVTSIAFPLFEAEGKPFASIAAGGPSMRVDLGGLTAQAEDLAMIIDQLNGLCELYIHEPAGKFW